MDGLRSLFPTAENLLALGPQELAPVLLRLAWAWQKDQGGGMFWPDSVTRDIGSIDQDHPASSKLAMEALVNETWNCLRTDELIIPAPGSNGRNGYMVLTKVGLEAASSSQALERVQAARAFPKVLLHPSIADKVWRALMRGDLDDAVFTSFKAVEEEVRAAAKYDSADIGVPLMRKAFDPDNGPLTDQSHPKAEREALAHLFAGAIGSYKNPHSHKTVNLTDLREVQEQIMLASHLLRIVDARRPI